MISKDLERPIPSTHSLSQMTWPEVDRAKREAPLVIVPVGSCEQHGPALALETDLVRAVRMAERVAEKLAPRAVVAPGMPYGVSEHHMAFPGTITVTPLTFQQVLYEVVESLYRHGWRKVYVLNGHGGNNATVDIAVTRLKAGLPDLLIAWSGITALVSDVVREVKVSEIVGHSCEIETAQALNLAPELVRRDRLARGTDTKAQLGKRAAVSKMYGNIKFGQAYDELSPTGALGNGQAATEEMGARLIDTAISRLCDFLEEFIALDVSE